jgi:hypothetical protein
MPGIRDGLDVAHAVREKRPGNKSEQRYALTQAIYTFRQGRTIDRSHEAQQYRSSGLNLAIAAIVYWNSTYMADAVAHLRSGGEAAPDDLPARRMLAYCLLWRLPLGSSRKGDRPECAQSVRETTGSMTVFKLRRHLAVLMSFCASGCFVSGERDGFDRSGDRRR